MDQINTNMTFEQLDRCFRDDQFPEIENDINGFRFLQIRSLSRSDLMEELMTRYDIDYAIIGKRNYFSTIFNSGISDNEISEFIRSNYTREREQRREGEDDLVDQLQRLQAFDWGGSHQNGLEKNIVDNYVKKIRNFEEINRRIESTLLESVRGYTLNSWYNHWTSIIIEDVFKDCSNILPAIGLVKKIDFFIDKVPFDLKVTYFPDELMEAKLKEMRFGVEVTKLKQKCRSLHIHIPEDLTGKALKIHLYNKLSEDHRPEAKEFIKTLNSLKKQIIRKIKENPNELKIWLYENQGEKRFDASNRFFLVLIDEDNFNDSWKLKRSIGFIRNNVAQHISRINSHSDSLNTKFFWKPANRYYECKSDIIFLSYSRDE